MADVIKGFNIELGLDHMQVNKGLKELNQEMKLVNSELNKNLASFDKGERSMERYETTIDGLNKKLDVQQRIMSETARKVDSLEDSYKKQTNALEKADKAIVDIRQSYDKLNKTYGEGSKELADSRAELSKNEKEYGALSKSVDKARKEFEKINKTQGDGSKELEDARKKLSLLEVEHREMSRTLETSRKKHDQLHQTYGEGSKELESARKELERAEKEHGELSKSVERTSKELNNSKVAYNNAEREVNKLRGSLDRTKADMAEFNREQEINRNSLVKFGRAAQSTADDMDEFAESMDNVANKAMVMGAAVGAVGLIAGNSALGLENSTVRMQNSLGLTQQQAEELAETALGIYQDGFGPSLEDVDNALLQVMQNMRDLDGADLGEVTRNALILAETFDTDVNEVTRAANNLMAGFGIEADEAFDLMAVGAQNGLNFSNELFDNLAEYSTLFGTMGYSADEYFMLLQAGLDAGAYNLYYINDVMKEFQIRVKDGSKGTADAMAEMSAETQAVWQSFLDGEATVKDVMQAVTSDLKGMEDQTYANELGVQLFGTKFEDLEAEAVYALGSVDGELKNVDGTVNEMADNLENSVSQRALSVFRELTDILYPLGEVLLDVAEDALPAIEDAVETATETISDMEPETLKTIAALGGVLLVAGPVAKAIGGIAKIGAPVVRFVGGLAEKLGILGVGAKGAEAATGGFGKVLGPVGKGLSRIHPVVGLVVGGIGLLAGGFTLAKEKIDWFGNTIDLARDMLGEFNDFLFEITGINWLKDQFVGAWEATEGFRNEVSLGMEVIGNLIGETFNEKIVEPFENFKAMHRDAGESVEVFDENISEMTISALENYVNLSENAKLALDELYYQQGEVTQAQVDDVIEKYQSMNDESLLKLEERRQNELDELNMLFEETGVLTDAEREAILADTETHYLTEQDQMNANNERIQEIISLALEEEGGLQSHHYEQIEQLQGEHNEKTVTALSDSEIEQQAILERMSTNQIATSEETVNELIANSEKAKNEQISDAATKRDEVIAEAIRQRDETGHLSEEEAQKIIDEAEKQYQGAVTKAEDKHRDVIAEASAQASEHGIIVDDETGEILSKWDVFAEDTMEKLRGLKEKAVEGWGEMWGGIGSAVETGINSVIDAYNWLMDKLGLDGIGHVSIGPAPSAAGVMSGGISRLPSYEDGTSNHAGGLAIVNDGGGPELLESPSGELSMAQGKNAIVDMRQGYKVHTAEQTRALMQKDGAGGLLDKAGDVLGRGAEWVGDKVSDIMAYASDPMALAGMALEQFGMSNPFKGATGQIVSGMFSKFKDGLTDAFKSMFEASAKPMAGILDPSQISYHYGHTAKYTAETGRYWHSGVDFPLVYQDVKTPIGGTVTHQPFDANGYGRWLTVLNGATKLIFAHLNKFKVGDGERVGAGDVLAQSGNTGFSTGAHLHLEYHDNGKVKDPEPWLRSAFRGSFANGGVISQHGIYEGAEGNLPEMVIPLTKPRRAIDLMFQALSLMGGNRSQENSSVLNMAIVEKIISALKEQNNTMQATNEILVKLLISSEKIERKELNIYIDEIMRKMNKRKDDTNIAI